MENGRVIPGGDFGCLKIYDHGFEISGGKDAQNFQWKDVEVIFGFKLDLMTTDEICLDLFFTDHRSIRLPESMHGWDIFNGSLRFHFPSISDSWEYEFVKPPFETNLTLLYDCNHRSLAEARKTCYDGS